MAAGLGFKTFTTGEVLTAADTNGYLMQGVLVFASAAARDAAITSPQEGQFAYLKDTNVTTYYTGSAWANLDTTGMTNPMTTTGDMVYSSSGSTPARLGIGTAGQVLKVNSGATAPEWGAAGASGMTLIKRASTSGAVNTGTTFDAVFTSTYETYLINIEYWIAATGSDTPKIQLRVGGSTTASSYYGVTQNISRAGALAYNSTVNQASLQMGGVGILDSGTGAAYQIIANRVGNSAEKPALYFSGFGGDQVYLSGTLFIDSAQTYDGFILSSASNITVTAAVYGLATA